MREKLEASAIFLEGLGPNEEFDLVRWHQITGNCLLAFKKYPAAIEHLEQSLAEQQPQWLARRLLTMVPLAEAYARQQERDASIATAQHIALLLPAVIQRCLISASWSINRSSANPFHMTPRCAASSPEPGSACCKSPVPITSHCRRVPERCVFFSSSCPAGSSVNSSRGRRDACAAAPGSFGGASPWYAAPARHRQGQRLDALGTLVGCPSGAAAD